MNVFSCHFCYTMVANNERGRWNAQPTPKKLAVTLNAIDVVVLVAIIENGDRQEPSNVIIQIYTLL